MKEPLIVNHRIISKNVSSKDGNIEYGYNTDCEMVVNENIDNIENNHNLAYFSIESRSWHKDYNVVNDSFISNNLLKTSIDDIPITYSDIYKLVRYLNTKMAYPIALLHSPNNYIEFRYPCDFNRSENCNIKFMVFTGNLKSRQLLIDIFAPKPCPDVYIFKYQRLNCLVKEEEDIKDFIYYLVGCLFGLWNKDNIKDKEALRSIKQDADHILSTLYYDTKEIDKIEKDSF